MIILIGNFAPVTYPMDEIGKQKLALCSWCVARPPHRLNGAHFYFYDMEDKKALSIKTVPVEIRVLLVDGKRMTLSVFNQIITGDGVLFSFTGINFTKVADPLGWVKIKMQRGGEETFLVYSKNGVLYKNTKNEIRDKYFGVRNVPGYTGHDRKLNSIYWKIEPEVKALFGWDKKYFEPDCIFEVYKYKLPSREDYEKRSSGNYDDVIAKIEELRPALIEKAEVLNKYESEMLDVKNKCESLFSDENQIFISI